MDGIALDSVEVREVFKNESPNLKLLKTAIDDYRKSFLLPEVPAREEVNNILAPLNMTSEELAPVNGHTINSEKIYDFIDRQDYLSRTVRSGWRTRGAEIMPPEKEYKNTLNAYQAAIIIDRFVFTPINRKENIELYTRFTRLKQDLHWESLEALGKYGMDLLGKNIASRFPYKEGIRLAESIKELALWTATDHDKEPFNDLFGEISELQEEYKKKHSRHYPFSSMQPVTLYEKSLAIDKVLNDFHQESWEKINPTKEEIKALYDEVGLRFLQTLYNGGVESSNGTSAIHAFDLMRDPRVIPELIRFLRRYPGGHTSNVCANTLSRIAENPLSKDDLQSVIDAASPLDRRIITEWLQEKESMYHQFNGYVKSAFIVQAPRYLALEKMVKTAKEIASKKGVEIDKNEFVNFFKNDEFSKSGIEDFLIKHLDDVAPIIAASGVSEWRVYTPAIFRALVHPEDGNFSRFPEIIAQYGLNLGQASKDKLRNLYFGRDLKTGIMARNNFAEGLLLLSGKEGGGEIAESILGMTTGAREDSSRVRDIFRSLLILEGLGEYKYIPGQSLRETAANLKDHLADVVSVKMELNINEKQLVKEQLQYLVETNVTEIIPSLLSSFESLGRKSEAQLVREIGRHIVSKDFSAWRESLQTGKDQLSVLSDEKKSAWVNAVEDFTIDVQAQGSNEARLASVEAIKRIVLEAKAHINDSYRMDFSPQRLIQLTEKQKQLIAEIKSSQSDEEKRDLGIQKRLIDAEVRLIQGMSQLESINSDTFNPQGIIEIAQKTQSAMMTLGKLEQSIIDLDQINRVFVVQERLKTIDKLRAYDTDDPVALLKAGAEPRETCQSWRGGMYNFCLPAYVVDVNKRVLNVENDRKEVVGRAIIKLTKIKAGDLEMPAILLEPIYTTAETSSIYRALIQLVVRKAEAVGAALVTKDGITVSTGADNSKTVELISDIGRKYGFESSQEPVDVYIPRSANYTEYSDTLGGVINSFDRYQTINRATVLFKS